MENDIEPEWDEILANQPVSSRNPATGYYASLVNALPEVLYEKIAVICWEKVDFRTIRSEIVESLGEKYMANVIITTPHDIHKWGADMWSDRFYFVPRVLQSLDELQENDRRFIIAMVGPLTLAKFFDVKTGKKKKSGIIQRVREFFGA
jgi:hypothetical protein